MQSGDDSLYQLLLQRQRSRGQRQGQQGRRQGQQQARGDAERSPQVPARKRPSLGEEATRPPVPRRKTRAAAAAAQPASADDPPPVPRRKTRAAAAAAKDPPHQRSSGGSSAESDVPRGAEVGTVLRKGATQRQCLAESPTANALLEYERRLRAGGEPGTLSAELRGLDARPAAETRSAEQVRAQQVELRRAAATEEMDAAAQLTPRYIGGVDLEARSNRADRQPTDAPAVDHASIPTLESFGQSGGWRGYDLPESLPGGTPRFPDGTPAPYEEGYAGAYGLEDGDSMQVSTRAAMAAGQYGSGDADPHHNPPPHPNRTPLHPHAPSCTTSPPNPFSPNAPFPNHLINLRNRWMLTPPHSPATTPCTGRRVRRRTMRHTSRSSVHPAGALRLSSPRTITATTCTLRRRRRGRHTCGR